MHQKHIEYMSARGLTGLFVALQAAEIRQAWMFSNRSIKSQWKSIYRIHGSSNQGEGGMDVQVLVIGTFFSTSILCFRECHLKAFAVN